LSPPTRYRGRLAPSPTGYLHLGHARTFWVASERARAAAGALILRNDDLDAARFRLDFAQAMLEDLRWLGLAWDEGPDVGGPHAPYSQSERRPTYRAALERLHEARLIYPCSRSRRDVIDAAGAPHEGAADDEPVYPAAFRPDPGAAIPPLEATIGVNWRLRVPDGEVLEFDDSRLGRQRAVAGRDFGDFPVWRRDDCPSYQLACAVDDAEMGVTEVVRGEDLVRSTFRQLLIYRALGLPPPRFHHCPLLADAHGNRLAKRHDALSLRVLRARGESPESIVARWADDPSAAGRDPGDSANDSLRKFP
jgi:glutamyl/glutaminyl-tRNA synthetase